MNIGGVKIRDNKKNRKIIEKVSRIQELKLNIREVKPADYEIQPAGVKTSYSKINQYWKDMGLLCLGDWDVKEKLCYATYLLKGAGITRCHIKGRWLGGLDEPQNLVPLVEHLHHWFDVVVHTLDINGSIDIDKGLSISQLSGILEFLNDNCNKFSYATVEFAIQTAIESWE